jgi:hypothetical protein
MQLTHFTIKNYKIIDDTGPIKVDDHVTALVGKNESGKSALMKAMWKSKNVAGARFDKLYDYPRDRFSKDRTGTQEVTQLKFALTKEEIVALSKELPQDIEVKSCSPILTTSYQGKDQVKSAVAVEWELNRFPTGQEARSAIDAVMTALKLRDPNDADSVLESARSSGEQISPTEPLWDAATVSALDNFIVAINKWIEGNDARKDIASEERAALAALSQRSNQEQPLEKARKWAEQNLPAFIYFDQYGQLRTLIHLPSYKSRKNKSEAEIRTQSALFEWSGLDPDEILQLGRKRDEGETDDQVQRRLEERRALLKSASFSLTGDWINWWTGEGHKLEFDVDGEYLVLQVSDNHNPFPIPFEERSQGFQWFFSFYLLFLVESKKAHKGAILLLDEPGLHLHPTLQLKLIDFFERVSKENQILYSTHLPFLVDGDHLDRVRTVHLSKTSPHKTIVSTDVRPTGDRDTLFPLQAALGYSIAQTLFMGKRIVIVEGITDYWLLKALDDCLAAENPVDALHEDTVLIPAGGTSKLMPLASVMLASMDQAKGKMLVLLDSDAEGVNAAKRLEDTFRDLAPTIMLGTALGMSEATIEDLIPRERYAEAIKKSGRTFEMNQAEKSAKMNVRAIEAVFERMGWGYFGQADKAATALAVLDDWGKSPSKVPQSTKENARALFAAINARFNPTS